MPVNQTEKRSLSTTEIEQRVAILKKLRENLIDQRDRFQTYLSVLENEEKDIQIGDMNKLEAHVELEKSIVSEIFAFQKVIDPLEELYRAKYPLRDEELPKLKASVESLKNKVQNRNKHNQELLKRQMSKLRGKIMEIGSQRRHHSVFASSPSPSFVDITT